MNSTLTGNLVGRQPVAAEQAHARLERRRHLRRCARRMEATTTWPVSGFGSPRTDDVLDVVHLEQHVLDFDREHLAAADVDDLALAAEDPQPLAVDLDEIAGVEEAVGVERARRVQVAEHRRLRPDPQPAVDDLGLVAFAADAHPQRVRSARLRSQDAELAQAVGLLQLHVRKRGVHALERRLPASARCRR